MASIKIIFGGLNSKGTSRYELSGTTKEIKESKELLEKNNVKFSEVSGFEHVFFSRTRVPQAVKSGVSFEIDSDLIYGWQPQGSSYYNNSFRIDREELDAFKIKKSIQLDLIGATTVVGSGLSEGFYIELMRMKKENELKDAQIRALSA